MFADNYTLILLSFLSLIHAHETSISAVIAKREKSVEHFEVLKINDKIIEISNMRVLAIASYDEVIHENGWTTLSVSSSENFPDKLQAYWSGYLETYLTFEITRASWLNTVAGLCKLPLSKDCMILRDYLSENLDFTIRNAVRRSDRDEYWYQVLLQMWQLKGISDAFNGICLENSTQLTEEYLLRLREDVLGVYLLQLSGDLPDLLTALSLHELHHKLSVYERPSCSALIKIVHEDVFLSHVTWSHYNSMLRVMKHYNFPWKLTSKSKTKIPGYAISFSSYPSVISSIDDFYITSAQIVTMETTHANFNQRLWSIVRNGARRSVLEGFRVMVANRLATTGAEWVRYFKRLNSGTYNNHWMIFDAKLYSEHGSTQPQGVLTVAEQLPGFVYDADVTKILMGQTYWASYNVPYFPFIYKMSGFEEKREQFGDFFDYHYTARAKIFRRDHSKVVDMASMYRLMRYNNYTQDPLSRCNCTPPYTSENAISARSDLNDPKGIYPFAAYEYRLHGGTDVKITNLRMLKTLNMLATSGPTYDDVPPFDWSKLKVPAKQPLMHPTRWTFEPVITDFGPFLRGLNGATYWQAPKLLPVFQN